MKQMIDGTTIARLMLEGKTCVYCKHSLSTIDPKQKEYIKRRDNYYYFCDEKNICKYYEGLI